MNVWIRTILVGRKAYAIFNYDDQDYFMEVTGRRHENSVLFALNLLFLHRFPNQTWKLKTGPFAWQRVNKEQWEEYKQNSTELF